MGKCGCVVWNQMRNLSSHERAWTYMLLAAIITGRSYMRRA